MEIIKFACDTEVRLKDLEHAGISYVPCGEVDGKDQPLLRILIAIGVSRSAYAERPTERNGYCLKGAAL